MTQRILIALDDSENSMRAAQFVAKAFTPDSYVTLFSVLQDTSTLCQLQGPELTPYFLSEQSVFCSLINKKKELMEAALQNAKALLVEAGFDANKVTIKLITKEIGIARDIIKEADSGYDLVVLGRRGLSGIAEFIVGSVSQKVLHGVKKTSVLLVN